MVVALGLGHEWSCPSAERVDRFSQLRTPRSQFVAAVVEVAHDVGVGEVPETIGEQVRCDAGQPSKQLVVTARPVEQLAHDQQSPAFTDDVEGSCEPAELLVGLHIDSLA